jgi:hypothetical protein
VSLPLTSSVEEQLRESATAHSMGMMYLPPEITKADLQVRRPRPAPARAGIGARWRQSGAHGHSISARPEQGIDGARAARWACRCRLGLCIGSRSLVLRVCVRLCLGARAGDVRLVPGGGARTAEVGGGALFQQEGTPGGGEGTHIVMRRRRRRLLLLARRARKHQRTATHCTPRGKPAKGSSSPPPPPPLSADRCQMPARLWCTPPPPWHRLAPPIL